MNEWFLYLLGYITAELEAQGVARVQFIWLETETVRVVADGHDLGVLVPGVLWTASLGAGPEVILAITARQLLDAYRVRADSSTEEVSERSR